MMDVLRGGRRYTDQPRAVKTKVLLIEDALDQLDVYGTVLQDAGHHVMGTTHGRVGYQLAIASPPDVVILDLELPDVDGWSLCTMLSANHATESVPIIILTASDNYDLPLRAARAGVTFLKKPCPVDRLLAAVRATVPHRAPL